jgi:hypothetical protein
VGQQGAHDAARALVEECALAGAVVAPTSANASATSRWRWDTSSAGISIEAALSPARCSQWPGFSPGVRSTVRKWAPHRTGESISMTSDTGAKETESADSCRTVRAVPYFQPDGSLRLAAKGVSFAWGPSG